MKQIQRFLVWYIVISLVLLPFSVADDSGSTHNKMINNKNQANGNFGKIAIIGNNLEVKNKEEKINLLTDCGGSIECACGNTVVENYTMSDDLICDGHGLWIANNVVLDCNSHTISGNLASFGIWIWDTSGVTVKNCHITNYSTGISFYRYSHNNIIENNELSDNSYAISANAPDDCAACGGYNNRFLNNSIHDNSKGIRLMDYYDSDIKYNDISFNDMGISIEDSSVSNNITNNIFIDNTQYGVSLSANRPNIAADNDFYGTGIRYSYSNNQFCINNVSNRYYDGAWGPVDCNCLLPVNGIKINTNAILCNGNYSLPSGISMTSNGVLDCDGSKLQGANSGIGIWIWDTSGVTVKNCSITNYAGGISFYRFSHNNIIENNELFNNDYAIRANAPDDCAACGGYNNRFLNNSIHDNSKGIRLMDYYDSDIKYNDISFNDIGIVIEDSSISNNITNNIFTDNTQYGVSLSANRPNIAADNDFYGTGIRYSYSNNQFCINNVSNRYYNGAWGPVDCNCLLPVNGFKINSNAILCNGNYSLPSGISMTSNGVLDCDGSKLQGANSGRGIWIWDTSGVTVKNCHITNYGTGITFHRFSHNNIIENNELFNNDYAIRANAPDDCMACGGSNNKFLNNSIHDNTHWGIDLDAFRNSKISGNSIVRNDRGVVLRRYSTGTEIQPNNYLNNSGYNVYNIQPYSASAEYNYWGTSDESLISASIYDYYDNPSYGKVDFEPFIFVSPCNNGIKDGDETGVDCGGSCLPCTENDLYIDKIIFTDILGSDEINVSVGVINHNINTDLIEVKIIDEFKGVVFQSEDIVSDVEPYEDVTASVSWQIEDDHNIRAIVDPNNLIAEDDESNNAAVKVYRDLPSVYVEADVSPTILNPVFEDYIIGNLEYGYYTNSEESADVIVYVARHNPLIFWHFTTEYGWGYTGNVVYKDDVTEDKPYGSVVGSFDKNGTHYVYVEANDVDGFIAGTKEFVRDQDKYINGVDSVLIDKYNEEAIAVYDYLHIAGNIDYYKTDTPKFADIVYEALNNNKFYIDEGTFFTTINGTGVNLRYKHLYPRQSSTYLEYKDPDGYPVVMAGGIWSDIDAWEELGSELSDGARDVWLIELTGGPDMECDTCPDYTYEDLTDNVFPVYISGVLNESGKSKVDYVGHSNGCRAALSSLNDVYADDSPVESFVGVACPTTLNEITGTSELARELKDGTPKGYIAIDKIRENNLNHIKRQDYARHLNLLGLFFGRTENKISTNLMEFYNDISIKNDTQIK